MILKTTAELRKQVIAAIKSMHSYETPAIVALDVTAGDGGFLDWVRG